MHWIQRLFAGYRDDHVPRMAAALAYYAIFAMGPLLVIAMVVAGAILGQSEVRAEILEQVNQVLGPETRDFIETLIRNLREPGQSVPATVISAIILLFTATNLFRQFKIDLDTLFGQPEAPPSHRVWSLVWNYLRSVLIAIGLSFLLVLAILLSASISFLQKWIPETWGGAHGGLWLFLQLSLSAGLLTVILTVLYAILPAKPIPWVPALHGAVVASVLTIIVSTLFSVYLDTAGTTSAYGAAGAVVALLFWVYVVGQILLMGAVVTRIRLNRDSD